MVSNTFCLQSGMATLSATRQLWVPARHHKDAALIERLLPSYLDTLRDGCISKGWKPEAADKLIGFGRDALKGTSEYELGVLADTHLFLFKVEYIFWLDKLVLCEYALLRYKPGDCTEAYQAIDQIARQAGVDHIVIGTSAAVRNDAYCRLLQQHGYQPASVNFLKVLE